MERRRSRLAEGPRLTVVFLKRVRLSESIRDGKQSEPSTAARRGSKSLAHSQKRVCTRRGDRFGPARVTKM